jgi:c-di-GMP-binding flagellar brake protein YcgR
VNPTDPAPSDVLYRSRIEIARILGNLAREACVLSADVGNEECLLLTRILHVDPGQEFLIVAYGEEKAANTALLHQETTTFLGTSRQARVEFTAAHPVETTFEDRAAVRFSFPCALIEMQRRKHRRYPVPAGVSLRCVADSEGFVPFEASIADISRGGLGAMHYDAGIHLPPGTILRRSRVVIPGREAVEVDLEVRHSRAIALPDGTWINRAGVRFVSGGDPVDTLLRLFVTDLDDAG